MNMDNSGLILEGGGLRGAFTTGVLDAFMENSLFFPYTIGVSAGAINGLSYIAHQKNGHFTITYYHFKNIIISESGTF